MVPPFPIDFSKTERIVLLVDLNPLLHLQNPNNYLTSLLTSVKTLLSFPPLSLSLSSFKLFFSSLSPLLSASFLLKLVNSYYNPNSLSFNHPIETLNSLSEILNSLRNLLNDAMPRSNSKGSISASTMAQVIHDYAWDLCDSYDGSDLLPVVRSNLVVMFSPVCRSFKDLCDFMGVDTCDAFCDKFRGVFGCVRDAFVSRDIHFSWVDVRCEVESDNCNNELDEQGRVMKLFQNGVKGLGWGFCSSDLIVLGSALVSFGLIFPMIGVSPIYCNLSDTSEKVSGQLNLEILDVSGKPLKCKYCDLQLLDLKTLFGNRPIGPLHPREYREVGKEICDRLSNGLVKLDVKSLCRDSDLMKMEGQISFALLVHELSVDSKKTKEESSREFFADRVLDLLSKETSKSSKRKSPPLWEILLSFLYRRGYCALVSLSSPDGGTHTAILKPFTINSAFLFIIKANDSHYEAQLEPISTIGGLDIGMDSVKGILGGETRRKHKMHPDRYKDLSWTSFCKAAFERREMELEEVYFSKGYNDSKKLKFLKCWMKQVEKNFCSLPCKQDKPKIPSQENRLQQLFPESERPLPSLAGENALKGLSQVEDAVTSLPEADAFFCNLSERIQQGIESGVDLVAFSQRVVFVCIYWLTQKLAPDKDEEIQVSNEKSDGSSCGVLVAAELIKILLKDPKDVAAKHKHNDQSATISSGHKVREYELQILFRMEILRSYISTSIRDSTKHKFIKQICSLLEFIQCNMEDGFFGDFNLSDYVGRAIRNRYSHHLGDIVHKIYEQMDLLFDDDDEDESPNPLLNSEDSNQSWRMRNNDRGSEPNSTDDSFPGPLTDNKKDDHERRLVEAQERRERASRFSSFTRRAMPELQRVWAPKVPKLSKSKSDSFSRRPSKRKDRQRDSYDMVCETPMTGTKKCLFPSEDKGGSSIGSIHKALFQDE